MINMIQVRSVAMLKQILCMTFRVFYDVAPCSHVEVDRRFRGTYFLHHQGDVFITLMMETVGTSESSVHFNVTTQRYNSEDSKLHTHRREKLKSQIIYRFQQQKLENMIEESILFVSKLNSSQYGKF
jgi:hypothetical protein